MNRLPKVQDNNEQILNDIQSLQQMEQQLFNSLESNPNLSTDEQKKIIDKMNQISNMRVNLYQTLSGVNNYFEKALSSSIGTLKEQALAIGVVENELNRAKKRLELLQEEKNNKIRLVEINTYYGDKYAEHSDLMKIVIFILIPVILLTFLFNKGFLPNIIFYILIVIIALIGGYFFWKRFASIIMRDNMNYQEYAWSFNPSKLPSGSTTISDPWLSNQSFGTCVGDACCSEGLVYDSENNVCVPGVKESFVNETMLINDTLTKSQQGKYKADYDLREPRAFNNID